MSPGVSAILGALWKRTILGCKLMYRDKALKWTPLLNLIFVLIWPFEAWSERLQYESKNTSTDGKQTEPKVPFSALSSDLLRLKFGFYFAILIGNSMNLGLNELFSERKKKMRSFLFSMGMSKISYYGFYVIFPALNMMLYSGLQVYFFLNQISRKDLLAEVYLLLILVSLSTSFALLAFSFAFKTVQAALGTILSILILTCGAVGYFSNKTSLSKPNSAFPLFEFLDYLLGTCNPDRSSPVSLARTFQILLAQLLGYAVLFVAIENISQNDYGFYGSDSLCRKKARNIPSDPEDRDSGLHHLPQNTELYDNSANLKLNAQDADQPERSGLVLSINNLKKSFGPNLVLQGLDLSVKKGDITCLLGANGAGKSTLFNIILENVEADDGDIWKSWGKNPISYCPQTDMGWDFITVQEHLEFIQYVQQSLGKTAGQQSDLYEKVVDVSEIKDHWTKFSKDLSGGYKRRLTIAMALLVNPRVTLLDEPTTSLDIEVRNALMKGLYRIREELGTTILYTTHHLEDAENFSDQIILLSNGKITLDGSMDQLRKKFNTATLVVTGLTPESLPKLRTYFSEHFDQVTSDMNQVSDTEAHIKFVCSADSELNIPHIEYIEHTLKTEVSLRLVSLEEVYITEGETEHAQSSGTVGKTNLLNCWGHLSANPDGSSENPIKPSFFKRTRTMLRKGSKLVTTAFVTDLREFGIFIRPVTTVLMPCIGIIAVYFAFLKPNYYSGEVTGNTLTREELVVVLFLGAIEQLTLGQPFFTSFVRIQEHESRMYAFLVSCSGSRAAWLLGHNIYEALHRLVGNFMVFIVCKSCILGTPLLTLTDVAIVVIYTIYIVVYSLQYRQTLTYFFDRAISFQTYSGLLSIPVFFVVNTLLGISIAFVDQPLQIINWTVPFKIMINTVGPLMPEGTSWLQDFLKRNTAAQGGCLKNLFILIAQVGLSFLFVVWVDYKKTLMKRKKQEGEPHNHDGLDLKNLQELEKEKSELTSQGSPLRVYELQKIYADKYIAAQNINFHVPKGQVLTLLGPNGAGKTSVLDVLCYLQQRTDGEFMLENLNADIYQNRSLTFCLQKNFLWERLTFREHLEIFAAWRGLDESKLESLISELSVAIDIGKNLDIRADDLSGGNKRKLNTVLAVLGGPKIYILDEPTAGVDPVSRRYFWNLLKGWKENSQCTMILTTHTANEAEELSDKIAIMLNSELIRVNTKDKITLKGFIVKFSSAEKQAAESWKQLCTTVKEHLEGGIKEYPNLKSEVNLLQSNGFNTMKLQIPHCKEYDSLTSVMKVCNSFVKNLPESAGVNNLNYFVAKTDLEQTFLSYASHQRQRDPHQ